MMPRNVTRGRNGGTAIAFRPTRAPLFLGCLAVKSNNLYVKHSLNNMLL